MHNVFDIVISYQFHSVNMDSAPLSASLLADWMDVTSTMDPKVLEDIQHELEMGAALHDFPFSYWTVGRNHIFL